MLRRSTLNPVSKKRHHLPYWKQGLQKVSAKRQAEQDAWDAITAEKRGGPCEARGFSPACTRKGKHGHHLLSKARRGPSTPENHCHVCEACHRAIHLEPARATAAGLLFDSWSDFAKGLTR